MDMNMINAANGGALVDKTHVATRDLIANIAQNAQLFRTRASYTTKVVNELQSPTIDQQRMKNKIIN